MRSENAHQLSEISHLTKYPCETFKAVDSELGRVKTRASDESTVPASASPGVVELAIALDTGRDGSAFRVEGCELAVTMGSSGSIV
jgi:hypothetical protein